MNHLINIIDALNDLDTTSSDAVLATVVKVEGSAYRQPSARMLIQVDGQAVGMVSGGCLEKHLVQRAFWLTRDGACVQRYHSAADNLENSNNAIDGSINGRDLETNDEQEGFGLGCNGTIHVLFERVQSPQFLPLKNALHRLKQDKQPQPLHTVIASSLPDLPIGQRLSDENFLNPTNRIRTQPASRKSMATIDTYQAGKFTWQVLSETLQPPLHLLIFGAGQDSLPLLEMAKLQGWVTTLIDSRADLVRLAKNRPIQADKLLHLPLANLANVAQLSPLLTAYPLTAVAIMTHSVTQDRVWLEQALKADPTPFYIGQLGPRYRTEQLLADIGLMNTPKNLLYPMGLPLGGDTPEAVALSTIAQIQMIFQQSILDAKPQ